MATNAKAFVVKNGVVVQNQNKLELQELSINGDNSVSLRAPASLSANYTLTLPSDDGIDRQVLQTNGSGDLSWVTPVFVEDVLALSIALG
jgi:hypothetical protein